MTRQTYFVYIMSSERGVLYVGVTNDLERRAAEHRRLDGNSFTQRYGVNRLAYFETCPDIRSAIAREKQIKGWRRRRKLDLVRTANPWFEDLLK